MKNLDNRKYNEREKEKTGKKEGKRRETSSTF